MKNFIIIDTNKDGSGNIVLGEYEHQEIAKKRAQQISSESGVSCVVCRKETAYHPDITERVKTYEDACRITDYPLGGFGKDTKDESAYKALKVIAKALNEGWTPNWDDKEEYKYYPWFSIVRDHSGAAAGLAFSSANYAVSSATTNIGSHLCFKTEALAKYAGKQFIKLWEDYLL